MAGFETQKKTTDLGEALVAELTKEAHTTPLSRWVAHYLAEQMKEAKKAKGKGRAKAQQQCFTAILQLWRHRESLPSGLHPFAGFDPIFATLASISPDHRRGYYIRDIDEEKATDPKSAQVLKMMKFIMWSDRTARVLIEAALESAVENARTPRTKAYLESVKAKATDADVLGVSQLLARRKYFETLDESVLAEELKKTWEKRVKDLKDFIAMATAIQGDFERRLEELSGLKKKA
jgi:hypothetical protein